MFNVQFRFANFFSIYFIFFLLSHCQVPFASNVAFLGQQSIHQRHDRDGLYRGANGGGTELGRDRHDVRNVHHVQWPFEQNPLGIFGIGRSPPGQKRIVEFGQGVAAVARQLPVVVDRNPVAKQPARIVGLVEFFVAGNLSFLRRL